MANTINKVPYLVKIEGGGGGTSDYNSLSNLPKIDGNVIRGDKHLSDYGAASIDFVNSSIATNTAHYISNEGKPFDSVVDLRAYSGIVTNNDYAFVKGRDSAGNTTYTRYKYSDEDKDWAEEYVLNNSSFTAAQWAAISSGITDILVGKLSGLVDIRSIGDGLQLDANGQLKSTGGVVVVQTTGQSTTSVMSQKAVSDVVGREQEDISGIKIQISKFFEGDDEIIIEPIE